MGALRAAVTVLLGLGSAGAVLTGCAGSDDTPATLPDGVGVDVYQTRSDVSERALEISVRNDSDATLVVTSAALDSTQFVEPAVWQPSYGDVEFAPGRIIDLRTRLPEPACEDPEPTGTVEIGFTVDGVAGTASLPIVDRFDRLPVMRDEECLVESLAQIATLTWRDTVRAEPRSGRLVGLVDLTLEPTGSSGSYTLTAVEDTVLLGLADDRGREVEEIALDGAVDGAGDPVTVTVPIIPHRCDPHAVAEDKQGTIFTFHVTVDGTESTFRLPTPAEVRSQIYAYFEQACGY